jgi:hypothetical protein
MVQLAARLSAAQRDPNSRQSEGGALGLEKRSARVEHQCARNAAPRKSRQPSTQTQRRLAMDQCAVKVNI